MRGRKLFYYSYPHSHLLSVIKKESPNEGTETYGYKKLISYRFAGTIKKESPNEGTETRSVQRGNDKLATYKKRIPE